MPLERARSPVIDDGPGVPNEARPLLRRARDVSQRQVHDEIGTWEERAFLPDAYVHVHNDGPTLVGRFSWKRKFQDVLISSGLL